MHVSALVLYLPRRFDNINHHRSESIYLYRAVGKKTSGEHEYKLTLPVVIKKRKGLLKIANDYRTRSLKYFLIHACIDSKTFYCLKKESKEI